MVVKTKPARITADRLRSYVERVERLEEERKGIGADIRDVYTEAKSGGFDAKTMRKVIALRKMDAADRDEEDALLDLYKQALGMDGAEPGATDSRLGRAAALFRDGKTVKQVMAEMGITNGTAGRLRQTAEMAGLLDMPRSPPPAATVIPHPKNVSDRVGRGMPAHDPDTGEIDEPPAGASPNGATEHGQVAAVAPPAAVPAGEPDGGPESAQQPATTNATARREGQDSAGAVYESAEPFPGRRMDDFDPARDMPECLRREKAAVLA